MRTTYYDTLRNGLIPVRIVERKDTGDVVIKVSRTRGPYRAGELLTVWRHSVVHVIRRTKYHAYVRTAE